MSAYHIYPGECAKCERQFTDNAADIDQALNEDGLCPNCAPEQRMIEMADLHREALAEDHQMDVRKGME